MSDFPQAVARDSLLYTDDTCKFSKIKAKLKLNSN